jgi:hypothetical protein
MRFASSKFVESRWLRLGAVRQGRTLKQATKLFCVACARVLKRCEEWNIDLPDAPKAKAV